MSGAPGPPLGTGPQRFDVFLSHNSRDRAVVERFAERLKLAGPEPWLDKTTLTERPREGRTREKARRASPKRARRRAGW
jgi:hypothetical protein